MPDPRSIPLETFHARHGARFVDFGGWNMPVQYSSILAEHRAVREAAGLFDVSHMGEFLIRGAGAGAFLDYLLTNRISHIAVGRAVYSPMCAESGGVIDDLIVYRSGEREFLLCVNASNIDKDFSWIEAQVKEWPERLELKDQSADFCLLALQGPKASSILAKAGFAAAAQLKRFHHDLFKFQNAPEVRICRTGYTGEDGFEIYVAPGAAETLAECLLEAGGSEELLLCGLGARDSLRLEAGLPLYGHELSDEISPIQAGLGWTVKLNKPDFLGKAALAAQQADGPRHQVIFFKLEGRRIARQGTAVIDSTGRKAGTVLSGTTSPMTGGPIGSALVETALNGSALNVDLRGHLVPLHVARPPLHQSPGPVFSE